MQIRESAEMYLETILVLSQQGNVRAIDIAKAMKFSRPSVSVTVHQLENEKYIKITENGNISLLKKGRDIAERIYERHTVLSALLESIGVDPKVAAEDACKIEHVVSDKVFSRLLAFQKYCSKNNEFINEFKKGYMNKKADE